MRKLQVGGEIDAYCGRCKLELNHMITALVDELPRRVRCLTCNNEHNFRLPKKTKSPKTRKTASVAKKREMTKAANASKWASLVANWNDSNAKPYSIYATFEPDDQLTHKTFGKGLVVDIVGPDKILTLFESGEKMLIQGRTKN